MHRYRKGASDSSDKPTSSSSLTSTPVPPRPQRAQTFSGQEASFSHSTTYDNYPSDSTYSYQAQPSRDAKRPYSLSSQSPYAPQTSQSVPPVPYLPQANSAPQRLPQYGSAPAYQSPAYHAYSAPPAQAISEPLVQVSAYPIHGQSSPAPVNSYGSTYSQVGIAPTYPPPVSISSDYARVSSYSRSYDIPKISEDSKDSIQDYSASHYLQDDYTALAEAQKLPGTDLEELDPAEGPEQGVDILSPIPGSPVSESKPTEDVHDAPDLSEPEVANTGSEDKTPKVASSGIKRKSTPIPEIFVRALFDFQATETGELSFKKGDEILVLESAYKDWWRGNLNGTRGIFPTNYVEVIRRGEAQTVGAQSPSRKSSEFSIVPSVFEGRVDGHTMPANGSEHVPTPPKSPPSSTRSRRMSQDAEKEAISGPIDVFQVEPPSKATLYLSATGDVQDDSGDEEDRITFSVLNALDQKLHSASGFRWKLRNMFAPSKSQYSKIETSDASIKAAIDHANASFWSRTRQHATAIVADFAFKMNTTPSVDFKTTTDVKSFQDDMLFQDAITAPLFMGFRIIYVLDNQRMAETAISHYFAAAESDSSWKRFRAWASRVLPAKLALRKASRFARMGHRLRRDFACGFEHNDRFSTSLTSGDLHNLLDVAKTLHDHGAYQRCLFNTVSQTPRHAIYFCHDDNKDQRTLIIVHSRPLHFVALDNYPRSWASEEIWRTLQDDFPMSVAPTSHDQIMFLLLRQVMTRVADEVVQTWTAKVEDLQTQFGDLESAIYADPASNDDLSTDLWKLSKYLLESRELMGHHVGTIHWLQRTVNQIATQHSQKTMNPDAQAFWQSVMSESWLQEQVTEIDEIAQSIEDNLKEPIDKTLDLMYKSISIRDAKLSLELNASLWRLSWITFIFLPLTFLVGFFGMNVDTFRSDPSIKWYFVTAVPFMVLVFVFWLVFKKALSSRYDNRRSKYERDEMLRRKKDI